MRKVVWARTTESTGPIRVSGKPLSLGWVERELDPSVWEESEILCGVSFQYGDSEA